VLGHSNLDESVSLSRERQICIFVDIIDNLAGFRKKNGRWTSSILVYQPTTRRVIAAFVALVSDMPPMLYYSTSEGGAFKMKFTNLYSPNLPVALQVANNCTNLADARTSSHGKKTPFPSASEDQPLNASFATLAEGKLDIVLQLEACLPHSVLPGVFIGLEAGAYLADERSEPLHPGGFFLLVLRPGILNCECIMSANATLLPQVAAQLGIS